MSEPDQPIDRAIVLIAHGTRDELGPIELDSLTSAVARRLPRSTVVLGYLSLIEPTAGDAIDQAVDSGATVVDVVPLLLTDASHARDDVPELIAEAVQRHPSVAIEARAPIGHDLGLEMLALERLRAAGADRTPLILLGRGGSNATANQHFVDRVERLGKELRSAARPAFAAIAQPTLHASVEHHISRGATRIAFFGWLMAHGQLITQARDTLHFLGSVAEIEIVDVGYFLSDVEAVAALITGPIAPAT